MKYVVTSKKTKLKEDLKQTRVNSVADKCYIHLVGMNS
jgi:hypothetical protein